MRSPIIGDFRYGDDRTLRSHRFAPRVSFLSEVPELGPCFLSFPDFLWLTAQVIPLRSGLRVFCCLGTSLGSLGTLQECRR